MQPLSEHSPGQARREGVTKLAEAKHEAGLAGYADRYFEVLSSGEYAKLPLAPGVVFRENGQALRLGRGLWATATGVADTRAMTVVDDVKGEVATWGLVREAGQDSILGLRLKAAAGLITEIETFVVRSNDKSSTYLGSITGLLGRERLLSPTPGVLDLVDEFERPTRDELRDAANGYIDGVSGDDASVIPVAEDCVRIENGGQTVLRTEGFPPGSPPSPATMMGVAEQVRHNATRHIAAARDRGMYVMDPSRGLVMIRFFFDHRGKARGWTGRSPFVGPNSMPAWEVFKVRGGLIRHIEAIIAWYPYGFRWGIEEDGQ